MPTPNRDQVYRELVEAPATYRTLVSAATRETLRRRTNGTRWTNREMLFHMLLGYLVARTLLPLVRVMSRLPAGAGRGFAATLNAGARPFHVVNYLGSAISGHLWSLRMMMRVFDRTCRGMARSLRRATDENLSRSMPFPKRWDPYFTEHMTLLDVYHYPLQHFEFHRRQLTIDRIPTDTTHVEPRP